LKVTINGVTVEVRPDSTILDAVHENGLDLIPTLCHMKNTEPFTSCYVCVVEVDGRKNMAPACSTPVTDGMVVHTRSSRVNAARRTALELLLSNHWADCVSPCLTGCPGNVDIQGYLALAAQGKYIEAVELIRLRNPLPAVCGRVCVRACEDQCYRTELDQCVSINWVKRFLMDQDGVYDGLPEREKPTGKRVAIVGSGPAGLTAAYFLGLRGHFPVLYEAMEKPGGMLRYGIPEYRLPEEVLDREIDYIQRVSGCEIRLNTRIGRDIGLEDVRQSHDAVLLSPGAWAGKAMRVDGEFDTIGVVTGADFLVSSARERAPVSGTVVVVGGGNTAMDAARTAWRLGANRVIILYRRTRLEMPCDDLEIEEALEEGIELMELAAPVGIERTENLELRGFRCIRMTLGEPDASGRRSPVPLEGSEFTLECDLAVSAIGQEPILDGLKDRIGLTRWKTIDTGSDTGVSTGLPGVFAAGDAAYHGPTVVIDAIRDGRNAAEAIHGHLTGVEKAVPFTVSKGFWEKPGRELLPSREEKPANQQGAVPPEKRRDMDVEVALPINAEQCSDEAERCLSCGCVRYDDCDLRLLCQEYGMDMDRFRGKTAREKVDESHPEMVYDANKCILCGKCVRTCALLLQKPALGFVGRGFGTRVRPAMDLPLVETDCTGCGNCADVCPTAAVSVKTPWPGRACLPHQDEEGVCDICSLECPATFRRYPAGTLAVGREGYLCPRGRFQRRGGPDIKMEGSPEEADVIVLTPAGRRWLELEFTPMAARVMAAENRGTLVTGEDGSNGLSGRVCRISRCRV
jgi:formate dehydrogenase major subunit